MPPENAAKLKTVSVTKVIKCNTVIICTYGGMGSKQWWRAVLTRLILQNLQEGISVILSIPLHRDLCSLFFRAVCPIHRSGFKESWKKKSIRWEFAVFCSNVCVFWCMHMHEVYVDIYPSIHPRQFPTWSWHSQKRHRYTPGPLCSRTRTAPVSAPCGVSAVWGSWLSERHPGDRKSVV